MSLPMNTDKIEKPVLEKAREADEPFIRDVYISTRIDEFALLGWADAELRAFLGMQYDFQKRSYEMQFPAAENSIIKNGAGVRVGRLIVERKENEIRLVDVALLPEYRGGGIGGKIISDLIEEARRKKLPLTLQVLKTNEAAQRLYQRAGFAVMRADEIYLSMEKQPS